MSLAGGRVLVLDNRDSFVFNLVDEFASRGAATRTLRSNLALAAFQAGAHRFRSAPRRAVARSGTARGRGGDGRMAP